MLIVKRQRVKSFLLACIATSLIFVNAVSANTEPRQGIHIVVSIKPLYLLVKELAAPSDTVELLLPSNSSPHHYQLNVSDRKRLSVADMVVWVGPELETFLSKPLRQNKENTFTIGELADINWPEAAHLHDSHGHKHDRDPHMWLDPYNLGVVVKALSDRLSRQAPVQSEGYAKRRDKILIDLAALDNELQVAFKKVADFPFIVMHPAYQHLVERYALNQQEFIVLTPERGIGAKHLYNLKNSEAKCVFGEVGESDKLVSKVADYAGAKVAMLDPLGFELSDKAPTTAVIRALAETMIDCLSTPEG